MSLFKKKEKSSSSQYADPDPNHPLRQLPPAAQQEFLRSGLTKEEVMHDWHVFLNCIYFQCRSSFTTPPAELVKQRSSPQHEKLVSLNKSSPISRRKAEQNRKDPEKDNKQTTRSRSHSINESEKQQNVEMSEGPKTTTILLSSNTNKEEKSTAVGSGGEDQSKQSTLEEHPSKHLIKEPKTPELKKNKQQPGTSLAISADAVFRFSKSSPKLTRSREYTSHQNTTNQQAPLSTPESKKSENLSNESTTIRVSEVKDLLLENAVAQSVSSLENSSIKEKSNERNNIQETTKSNQTEQESSNETETTPQKDVKLSPQMISIKPKSKTESPTIKRTPKHSAEEKFTVEQTQPSTEETSVNKQTKDSTKEVKNAGGTSEAIQSNKNISQTPPTSLQNETKVLSSPSSARKILTTSSKGTPPSVKRNKKSVPKISEEELNQLFVKANPKDYYTISHKIGRGSFATVYIGKPLSKTERSKRVAIKVMQIQNPTPETKENEPSKEKEKEKEKHKSKDKETKKDSKVKQMSVYEIANEIRLLNSCQHKNIVKHIMSFMWKDHIWTVMEYCDGGTLKDLLRVTLDEIHIAYVLRELLEALKYLHERNRIHRDLKSDNILLNVNGDVKIADLGLSTEVGDESSVETSIAGSRYWLAPEMLRGEGYNVKADIWSLGCVALEMAEGKPPYYQYHPLKAIFYTATRGAPPLEKPSQWSSLFTDFLSQCFQQNPQFRPSATELLEHPFLQKAAQRKQMEDLLKMAFMLKVTEGLEC